MTIKTKSILKELGLHIQMLRKQKGLTQQELAKKVNINRSYMGYIEQGRNAPSLKLLIKIAQTLDTQIQKFFAD